MQLTDGIIKTNLVWAIETQRRRLADPLDPRKGRLQFKEWIKRLADEKVSFSDAARDHQFLTHFPNELPAAADPRVVGLLVQDGKTGFVNPLHSNVSDRGWSVSKNYLPFHAGHIQDSLIRLLDAAGVGLENTVPELVGFSIEEQLNEYANGSSMHIAGLISIIDAINGKSNNLFARACAVVMPSDDKFVAVDSIGVKLSAFVREFREPSMLLCTSDFVMPEEVAPHIPEDVLWRVDSYGDLANRLMELGLLSAFKKQPFRDSALVEAKRRILWFTDEKRTQEALFFVERLSNAAEDSGLRVQQSIELELEELNRNCGRCDKAIEHSRRAVRKLEELGPISSFQEVVDANVRLAAALFDGHQFTEAIVNLTPFIEKISNNADLLNAETEIKFRNTLGRLRIAVGHTEWELEFRKSLELQKVVDKDGVSRTLCYLVHGLLRVGRLEDAKVELKHLNRLSNDPFSRTFCRFYEADYRRRSREEWDDGLFEETDNHVPGYVFGFYLQATARQPRSVAVSAERFRMAALHLKKDGGSKCEVNVLRLFGLFLELASKQRLGDSLSPTMDAIDEFLRLPNTKVIDAYYRPFLSRLDGSPASLEALLESVPYF